MESELVKQSIEFSIEVIEFYKWLRYEKKEYIMSQQLLKSATSIGANIHEANYAISKADFISKMHISLKEAAETEYWLLLLSKTNYTTTQYPTLWKHCQSLKHMLISTLNTAKA